MAEDFFPVDVDRLVEQVWTSMWEATIQKIDIELWPFIEKINVLEPNQYKDPSVKQLFNWLVDQKRTSEELNYIFGPVVQSMNKYNQSVDYVQHVLELNDICPLFLGILIAETLAYKSPILLGLWENLAWFFVKYSADFHYTIDNEQLISDRLNDWIICMMSDPELCPNPYLRLEFMDIFGNLAHLNDDNERQAYQSFMINCSTLNREPIKNFLCIKENNIKMLWSLLTVIIRFSSECQGILEDYDQELFDKLMPVSSVVIPDAQCLYEVKSNINKCSYEVNFLRVLFQTISGYAHQFYQYFIKNLNLSNKDLHPILDDFYVIPNLAKTILIRFEKSCKTPHLIDATASCVMDVLESALLINISLLLNRTAVYKPCIDMACQLLEEIVDDKGSEYLVDHFLITQVGQILIHKYHVRFSILRQQLQQLNSVQLAFLGLNDYDTISSFLYHCNYFT